MDVLGSLASFLWLLLGRPLPLGALLAVAAVLVGALRGLGLPRLFWHERPLHRFVAGAAATLLAAEVFLVSFLLAVERPGPLPGPDLAGTAAWGAGTWAAFLGLAALLRVVHRRRPSSAPRSLAHRLRISPSIAAVDGAGPEPGSGNVGALLAGAAAGGVLAWLVVFGPRGLPAGPWLTSLADALEALRPMRDRSLHLSATLGALLMLASFVLLRRRATPAVGICFLLGLLVAAGGALEFWTGSPGVAWLAVGLGLLLGGWRLHKLHVSDLEAHYPAPRPYPPPAHGPPAAGQGLLPFDAFSSAWEGQPPRPLIVLCTSGGGLRSATWTAGILGRLDELAGFRGATRLVTGASGGMVGAAAWIARAAAAGPGAGPAPGSWSALLDAVGTMDSLTAVARRLVFHDIPMAFLPVVNRADRGEALGESLDGHLRARLGCRMDLPLSDLRGAEARGELPSLIFSPMLVEDGRRLVIGNLDLSELTDHRVRWLSSAESGAAPSVGLASRTAYHLAEIFPDSWQRFRLATAARLSAAFPYVSPAVLLPTLARRRVVDAGYFDNYGLELGCSWLRRLLTTRADFMRRQVSRVLLVQVRDNVSELSVNPSSDDELGKVRERDAGAKGLLGRGLEGLTSPPQGLLTARESAMLFRNDAQLESLWDLCGGLGAPESYLTTTIFEFRGEASLSWTLAEEERALMRRQVASRGIAEKLAAVAAWLGPPGGP